MRKGLLDLCILSALLRGEWYGYALVKALEAAGRDLTADSFRTAMEGLQYEDVINDVPVNFGPDHQGGDLIVISKVDGGKWIEVGRIDPTQSQ
jgi:branched-chain amino acid transport system substrate-binding protein